MNLIDRTSNIVNGKNDLMPLTLLEKFPVFMGCVESPPEMDKFSDMNFYISASTGIIQINPILPLDVVYQSSHGSGTVGKSWILHHHEFSKFINEFAPQSIFEIGGGSGILSKKYNSQFSHINWTILEPNPDNDSDANIIKGFFDENFTHTEEFDFLVHSHVLEHIFYPDKFLADISEFLNFEQKMIFSVPNLKEMFNRYYTNCINFEHTILLTEEHIDHMLSKHQFKILSKKYFLDDHSIFYAVEKNKNVTETTLPKSIHTDNNVAFFRYIEYFDKLIKCLNKKMNDFDGEIYLFGGHIFSQFLINRGLTISKIVSIVDNDINKQGKRLYGTPLMVQSPYILRDKKDPAVILFAANYDHEIKMDIINNINKDTMFFTKKILYEQ